MVVIKRPVPHYFEQGYKNPEGPGILQSGAVTGKILQATTYTGLTGLLLQLSDVTRVAHEMFDSIFKTTTDIHNRVKSLGERVQNVKSSLDDTENYLFANNASLLFTTGSTEWKATNTIDQQNINKNNVPAAIAAQYEKCAPNPNFDSLDVFSTTGSKCEKQYSDPGYFFKEWAAAELRKQEALKEKIQKERTAKKQERLTKVKPTEESNKHQKKVPQAMRWRDKKNVDNLDLDLHQHQPQQNTFPRVGSDVQPMTVNRDTITSPITPSVIKSDDHYATYQPSAHTQNTHVPEAIGIPPPPKREAPQISQPHIPPPQDFNAGGRKPVPPPPIRTNDEPSNVSTGSVFPPPPPPMGGKLPPPPPPPDMKKLMAGNASPSSSGGGGRGGLLSDIMAGTTLRSVSQSENTSSSSSAPPRQTGQPLSLMDQLKENNKLRLKKVDVTDKPATPLKAVQSEPTSVADILKMKFQNVNNDSDDEDDALSDDDEWA